MPDVPQCVIHVNQLGGITISHSLVGMARGVIWHVSADANSVYWLTWHSCLTTPVSGFGYVDSVYCYLLAMPIHARYVTG
jgi:hypothetical protein